MTVLDFAFKRDNIRTPRHKFLIRHPRRRFILWLLADGPKSGSEISLALGLGASRFSVEMLRLRDAGMIVATKGFGFHGVASTRYFLTGEGQMALLEEPEPIKMTPAAIIGRRITSIRMARGIQQKTLAARAGIGAGTVYCIEAGRYAPSLRNLIKLADALKTSTDDILGRLV